MRVLLADDHALFCEAMEFYMARTASDLAFATVPHLHGAMEALRDAPDDIGLVLLDLRMPGMNGLGGLEKIRRAFPDMPVAILSGLAEEQDVDRALDLGARGYLSKTMPLKALLDAVRQLLRGEIFVARDHNTDRPLAAYAKDSPLGFAGRGQADYAPQKLSPRETQVLNLLADGLANKLIAERLGLQIVTIKLHVRGVCRKLGVANRTQAALRAREYGL